MSGPLISKREALIWAVSFVTLAFLLVWSGFTSTDADSALYAGLSDRLSQEPVARWIAPEWWGFWPTAYQEGLFREHPAGVFWLPTALTRIGIPALQGAYVVGTAAGLASLLLMAALIRRFASRDDTRVALVLLQLMPVAFVFRIRANHEYPMLVCLLVALLGLAWVSEGRRFLTGTLLVAVGMTFGLFIKGVFAVMILLACGVWIVLNPLGKPGARLRSLLACVVGLLLMLGGAFVYERVYVAATAMPFWSLYWQRQMGPLAETGAWDVVISFLRNVLFYVSRALWHPAPWSLALVIAAWGMRRHFLARWRALPAEWRRGLLFALGFAATAVLFLAPASRFAERYAFSPNHAIACAGAVTACRVWPALTDRVTALDRRIPALPALLWLALALLRLGVGSLLPRL